MSLTKVSLTDVVKKQFAFKFKSYFSVFSSLAIMQIVGLLFSMGGVMSAGYGGLGVTVTFKYYSADTVVVFTFLWAFISAIIMTTKANRYDDFAFVTNRVSSNLSNVLFLLASSVVGGITAMMSGYLLRVIVYLFSDIQIVSLVSPKETILGIIATILYVFFFSALGYVVGMLIQISRLFIVVLPTLFFGGIIVGVIYGKDEEIKLVLDFLIAESSILLFFLKIMLVAGLMFAAATGLSNRMEVRK